MIKATLTTTMGTTKGMEFDTKEHLLEFIELFGATLPRGTAVNIDAPLVGIHSGWIQGRSPRVQAATITRRSLNSMGTLLFCDFVLYSMYHTSGQNIQILGYLGFTKFFRIVL